MEMNKRESRRQPATAQERWKRHNKQWSTWLGRSLVLAVLLHAGVLGLWPQMQVDDAFLPQGDPLNLVYVPAAAEVEAPTPPGEIARPALPEVGTLDLEIADELAAPLPAFTDAPMIQIPAPSIATSGDQWVSYQHFAPSMVRPEIRNRMEVNHFLINRYYPLADATGEMGVVRMLFWIDEAGQVQKAELAGTSGSQKLDQLAMELSEIVRFRPAMRAGDPVRVKVVVPIEFSVS